MKTINAAMKKKSEGFTLIEALIGIFLISVALMGLAQMFLMSVANNVRADRITTATYLAQERIDELRSLTTAELSILSAAPGDETLDLNNDLVNDYRRITVVNAVLPNYEIRILIYSAERLATPLNDLLTNPDQNRVWAQINTVISR